MYNIAHGFRIKLEFDALFSLPYLTPARGVQEYDEPPHICEKGPLLATKWAKDGVFVRGLRE